MSSGIEIDTTFDFRTDAGVTATERRRDPDQHSPTLRRYHRLLWSKPLPSGEQFDLSTMAGVYLHHRSPLGEFFLASDSIIHTLSGFPAMRDVIAQIPQQDQEAFHRIGYTIGGMMVFPGNRVDGKPTLNGARGMHPGIRDRFDLTLECIRRHYAEASPSPLGGTIARYDQFFRLFQDFAGYVKFFLLEDLVTETFSGVRFFTPFDGFPTRPLPTSLDEYREYRRRAIEFVESRNRRISLWAAGASEGF